MSFFERRDPTLRELISYVVARALGREITVTQTKLVKLLYLIDVERHAQQREGLTGLPWIFFHYGPYAMPLAAELDRMEGREIAIRRLSGERAEREVALYVGAPQAPDADDWPAVTKAVVDRVIDRWAPVDLNELLDHVYFHTAPMQDAIREQPLDLTRAREKEPTYRPLDPPPAPADAGARIAAWMEKRRAARRHAPLDPPPAYDADYWRLMRATSGHPSGDPADVEAAGRLEVSEDIQA